MSSLNVPISNSIGHIFQLKTPRIQESRRATCPRPYSCWAETSKTHQMFLCPGGKELWGYSHVGDLRPQGHGRWNSHMGSSCMCGWTKELLFLHFICQVWSSAVMFLPVASHPPLQSIQLVPAQELRLFQAPGSPVVVVRPAANKWALCASDLVGPINHREVLLLHMYGQAHPDLPLDICMPEMRKACLSVNACCLQSWKKSSRGNAGDRTKEETKKSRSERE